MFCDVVKKPMVKELVLMKNVFIELHDYIYIYIFKAQQSATQYVLGSFRLSIQDYSRETFASFTQEGVHVSQNTGVWTSRARTYR